MAESSTAQEAMDHVALIEQAAAAEVAWRQAWWRAYRQAYERTPTLSDEALASMATRSTRDESMHSFECSDRMRAASRLTLGREGRIRRLVGWIEELQLPQTTGLRAIERALRDAGYRFDKSLLSEARRVWLGVDD